MSPEQQTEFKINKNSKIDHVKRNELWTQIAIMREEGKKPSVIAKLIGRSSGYVYSAMSNMRIQDFKPVKPVTKYALPKSMSGILFDDFMTDSQKIEIFKSYFRGSK